MKITNLNVENFKGVAEAKFVPQKINVLFGKNGSGKSSVLEAVKTALTGTVAGVPVKNGAKEAVIDLEVFGQTVTRKYSPKAKVLVGGKTTTQKSVVKLFEDNTGVSMDTAKLLTSGKLIASMKSGSLADFLFANNLIPVEVDADKVMGFTSLSPEAQKELSNMLPAMPTKFGMDTIADAHDNFAASRTLAKKELAIAQAKSLFEGEVPTKTVEAIDKELLVLTQHEERKRQYKQQVDVYNRAVEKRAAAMEKLTQMEKKASGLKVTKPDEAQAEHMQKLNGMLNNQILNHQKSLTVLSTNLEMFQKTLKDLEAPICPLSKELVCTTDKRPIGEALEKQAEETKNEISRLNGEISDLQKKREQAEEKLALYRQQVKEYQEAQILFSQIKTLKENLPDVPAKPVAPKKVKGSAELIEELKAEKENALRYAQALEAQKETEQLTKKVAVLEELVKALDPKGSIHGHVLEAALTPLEEYCNEQAEKLKSDFRIGISVEDGVRITCQPTASSGYLDLANVSSGEQLLATFLIMDMLNALSGFGIMLIDDLDKLDGDALETLLALITKEEVIDQYDHIFIAAVDHDDTASILTKYASSMQLIYMGGGYATMV